MAKKRLKDIQINRNWCKGCGICIHFCPKQVFDLDERDKSVAARPQDCICCMECEMRCPDLAITVIVDTEKGGLP